MYGINGVGHKNKDLWLLYGKIYFTQFQKYFAFWFKRPNVRPNL